MDIGMFEFWIGLGALLVLAEALLPGLVVVFLGLGALTVGLGIHLGYVEGILQQCLTWFISSTVYIFTLRVAVVAFYPSDTKKQSVNEDADILNKEALVIEDIDARGLGRIKHDDSTWNARSQSGVTIGAGTRVKIVGRDNITWLVEPLPPKDSTNELN